MKANIKIAFVAISLLYDKIDAYGVTRKNLNKNVLRSENSVKSDCLSNTIKSDCTITGTTRREAFLKSSSQVLGILSAVGFTLPQRAKAAKMAYPQEKDDKEKIVKGFKRLDYLVANWDKETTVCGKGQDNPYLGCERTPEKVMEYLGFKSMDDPLFRADKTLMRLQTVVPSEYEGDFIDAMEVYNEKSEEGSGIAFVSSWGEANPGGGKDRVAVFIERSKKDVIDSRDSLETIIRVLNLKIE